MVTSELRQERRKWRKGKDRSRDIGKENKQGMVEVAAPEGEEGSK